jgi:hypothetical protein
MASSGVRPTTAETRELQTVHDQGSSTFNVTSSTHHSCRVVPKRDPHSHKRSLSEATGVLDGDLLANLRGAGYTPQTIALIEFAPLVRLAWADGRISQRQRAAIEELAVREDVRQETPAGRRLRGWLEHCPPEKVIEVALSTLRARWDRLPLDASEALQRRFIRDCTLVARSADRVDDDHKIAPDEGRVLAKILRSLMPERRVR